MRAVQQVDGRAARPSAASQAWALRRTTADDLPGCCVNSPRQEAPLVVGNQRGTNRPAHPQINPTWVPRVTVACQSSTQPSGQAFPPRASTRRLAT